MGHRPYPDADRALAQLERRRAPEPPSPLFAWIGEHLAPEIKLADWQRAWLNASIVGTHPKRTGRTAITAAIVDQAVKADHHVHVAGRDGVRCYGGAPACSLPRADTDAELHARFAHPAYEYRTTEGPRKQWDDVDVPPADDNGDPDPTWERNADAGRDGWERLDYTEESYWRRRKSQEPNR
ncbi:hypothetical protein WB388_08725 [Streptomyces brasiliscabiei]|uniref:Uncharacterized protein n=1 Tax=Streptomyces brasiliscabiei TaxID=2736302 RepID=A0ABU8GA53_9ACTN